MSVEMGKLKKSHHHSGFPVGKCSAGESLIEVEIIGPGAFFGFHYFALTY
jgi:hypothetical protein